MKRLKARLEKKYGEGRARVDHLKEPAPDNGIDSRPLGCERLTVAVNIKTAT